MSLKAKINFDNFGMPFRNGGFQEATALLASGAQACGTMDWGGNSGSHQ
jgi:hypothetical protein